MRNKKATDELELKIKNTSSSKLTLVAKDYVYLKLHKELKLKTGEETSLKMDTKKHKGWYQISLASKEDPQLEITYAGRLETVKTVSQILRWDE
ncbi:hypothetical protein [Algoriphagus antarcticus]|uniref:Bacterial phospholipase C C-terminal domain-containing protein n=1 Tax=Algoriphagus antarcticus TaxID=238540 RepID=A0A3E0DG88_9BACT|nr:hypothetical protein [Algoriphagus antarcticus]REG81739.1 hypothetical protein C8N25_12584 [Algoriphagus antarcticus]